VKSAWLRDVLSWVLPSLVFFAVWFFLFRKFAEKQGMGGFMSIGKSRAKEGLHDRCERAQRKARRAQRPRQNNELGKVCTTVASGRSARRTERSDRDITMS